MSQHLFPKKLEISDRFVLLRKSVGNQSELARLLGISNDYVSMIETGKRTPGPRLLKDFEELERKFGQALSDKTDSVEPGVAIHDDPTEYVTVAQCKARIKELETLIAELRITLRVQARELNSAPPSGAAELARRAGAAYDAQKPNPPP